MSQSADESVEQVAHDGALPIAKAVEFSGLSRSELYKLMQNGELMFVKHGKRRLIPRNALRAILAKGIMTAGGA
jgi:excisionase family DNA binding protein